jgi:hypothetical protein
MKAVILLSKTFFKGHPKAGQPTDFKEKVKCGTCKPSIFIKIEDMGCEERACNSLIPKIHTCRTNYEYWKKKIDRLKAVNGVLSIRQWSGKPYRSPQEIIADIPASEIGVQKVQFYLYEDDGVLIACVFNDSETDWDVIPLGTLSANDGLSEEDFKSWFKDCNLTQPMAIIHFTKFRY